MIYIKLFLTFLKIGFVGFGGGMAILPLIYQGVSKFVPLTQADFADLFGISPATPGPIAINAATFVGICFTPGLYAIFQRLRKLIRRHH